MPEALLSANQGAKAEEDDKIGGALELAWRMLLENGFVAATGMDWHLLQRHKSRWNLLTPTKHFNPFFFGCASCGITSVAGQAAAKANEAAWPAQYLLACPQRCAHPILWQDSIVAWRMNPGVFFTTSIQPVQLIARVPN